MFAVIDCGTTNTRIFVVNDHDEVVASGTYKVGVRDTSITGSRETLKHGVETLYRSILADNGIDPAQIQCAVASGMITSEIGLIEIPHLVAPVGMEELSSTIVKVEDKNIIDLGVPVYFIRGIKNNYAPDATVADLRSVDFMRGEEVQCIGIVNNLAPMLPVNIIVFSSHTKLIHIDENRRICHCITTLSGQLYEALKSATNLGKSLISNPEDGEGQYSYEQIVENAQDCVRNAGIVRTMLMPRFMEVLLETTGKERQLFVDAAIAEDDMKALDEFLGQGYHARQYILFGHPERCQLYTYLLRERLGEDIAITSITDKEAIFGLTIQGAMAIAKQAIKK